MTHFHGDEAKNWEKKIQEGRLKKAEFFNSTNSQYFFAKISGIAFLACNQIEGEPHQHPWHQFYPTHPRTNP